MKIEKYRRVGRPVLQNKRVRYNIALNPTLKNNGAKRALLVNKSFSRYVEDLINADLQKADMK